MIGFGEVGCDLTRGLRSAGVAAIAAWKRSGWDELSRARALEAGATPCDSLAEMAREADMVFSAVTASATVDVAEAAAPFLEGKLYLDLNSTSPMAKQRGADALTTAGGRFVDGAIMGALHVFHHRVPILLSGPDAEEVFALLSGWGMHAQVAGEQVGQASAVKMLRSVYMKGIEATVLETMIAANRYGVLDTVLQSLAETHSKYDFMGFASMLVVSNALNGERRAQEMEQVVLTLKDLGVEPMVSEGALRRLRWSADQRLREPLAGTPNPGYKDVLRAIDNRNPARDLS
jgi:3-hydroxyisobutyrate dehydrogenase